MRPQNKLIITSVISIILLIALVVSIAVSFGGSSGSDKSVEEVKEVIAPLFQNEGAQEVSSRFLRKYYDLNASDYEGVSLFMPNSNMDAQEMLIIKLADTSQAEAVSEAINTRLETQLNAFDGYAPVQYDLCSKAIVDVRGNYILFVIHENAAEIEAAFRRAL